MQQMNTFWNKIDASNKKHSHTQNLINVQVHEFIRNHFYKATNEKHFFSLTKFETRYKLRMKWLIIENDTNLNYIYTIDERKRERKKNRSNKRLTHSKKNRKKFNDEMILKNYKNNKNIRK